MDTFETLIEKIGDPYFSIDCIENQHSLYPDIVKIIDCEDETTIFVKNSNGYRETLETAEALVTILNYDLSK